MLTTDFFRSIAGFAARCEPITTGGCEVVLWRVADLERHVDRTALLGGIDPPEPPYWAHLWSGAAVLARAVPPAPGRVLELGCGLGLPGLVAACRGGTVAFVDRIPEALAFVRASIEANRLRRAHVILADMTTPPLGSVFDLVLAAEVLYDRAAFAAMARAIAGTIAPWGRALLADAHRMDTRAFYGELARAGLVWTVRTESVDEEGFPVSVDVVDIRHAPGAW